MRIFTSLFMFAVLAAGGYLYLRGEAEPEQLGAAAAASDTRSYQNQDYGFSFSYPTLYAVQEHTPEHVSIGMARTSGFESIAYVTLLLHDRDVAYASYEQFLADRTRMMCASDSPGFTMRCINIKQEQSFETAAGLPGIAFYLSEETTNIQTGTTTASGKGPFFAIDVSANAPEYEYAAVLVHAPIALSQEKVNAALIQDIANSLRVEALGTR